MRLDTLDRDTAKRLNVASRTLWNICIFGFSFDILKRLTHTRKGVDSSKLPEFWSSDVSEDERRGFHGLSYGLIHRMTGGPPVLCWNRPGGGQAVAGGGGFKDFPLTWEARLEILFDFENTFRRTNWENARWRNWFRYCYEELRNAAGPIHAETWRTRFPTYAAGKLTVLPRFEADKLFQVEKLSQNISDDKKSERLMHRGLKWQAAIPIFHPAVTGRFGERRQEVSHWQMLTQVASGGGSATKTPNALPELFSTRRGCVNGQRLKHIDELIGARDGDLEAED